MIHVKKTLITLILTAMTLLPLNACSEYSSQSLTIDNAKTISVKMFDNQTFWRGLEFDLTEAVSKEVRSRSGLQLIRSKYADLVMTGNILEYSRPVVTEGSQDVVKEGSVQTVVRVIVTRKNGTTLINRTLEENRSFVIARGENEETARIEAFEIMAEDIVNLLERDW